MIFESVTVENWRSYYGEQTIRFSSDKIKNTTLVYAQNGVGKTNLLNAILWCLHGELTSSFKRPRDILNHDARDEGRKSYHVNVYLRDHSNQTYRIMRSGGEITNFKVFKIDDDGNSTPVSRQASLFVNSILPKDMARYFLNDGEGDDLTSDENGMIAISKSIEDILGFRMAKKTLEDLRKIRREYYSSWKKISDQADVTEDLKTLEKLKSDLKEERKLEENNQAQLQKYNLELSKINQDIGNSDIPTIKAKQNQRNTKERFLKQARSKLVELKRKQKFLVKEFAIAGFGSHIDDSDLDFLDYEGLKGKFPGDFNLQLVKDIISRGECLCGTKVTKDSEALHAIMELTNTAADSETLDRLRNARAKINHIKAKVPQIKRLIKENFNEFDRTQKDIQTYESDLEQLSKEMNNSGIENIKNLERQRVKLNEKIGATNQAIGRSQTKITQYERSEKAAENRVSSSENLSPKERQLSRKIELIDSVVESIEFKLKTTMESVLNDLQLRIDQFIDTYLQQDYSVTITEDKKIGLVDRLGNPVAPSKGQQAMLKFIFISTLVSIAREHRDVDTNILTAGAIAPLIFDAPFSDLQPSYANNVANTLPGLVDQLVTFMFHDKGKPVDEILKENGRLGKVYCLHHHSKGNKKENIQDVLNIDGVEAKIASYGQKREKVSIEEVVSYV